MSRIFRKQSKECREKTQDTQLPFSKFSTVTLKRQTDSLIRNLQESYIYLHVRESLRFKRTQKAFKYSLAYPQNRLLNSGFRRYRTEMATVVYSKGNPVCHVTGLLVFIGQSCLTQQNPKCHVTGPLVFNGQSSLKQSEVTFGLIAGYPFSPF